LEFSKTCVCGLYPTRGRIQEMNLGLRKKKWEGGRIPFKAIFQQPAKVSDLSTGRIREVLSESFCSRRSRGRHAGHESRKDDRRCDPEQCGHRTFRVLASPFGVCLLERAPQLAHENERTSFCLFVTTPHSGQQKNPNDSVPRREASEMSGSRNRKRHFEQCGQSDVRNRTTWVISQRSPSL